MPVAESGGGISRRDVLRITAMAGVSTAFGGALGRGLLRDLRLRRVSETRTYMGTVVTLTVVTPDAVEARRWIDAGFHEMKRLEDILSRHRDDTAVGRLNGEGRVDGAPEELVEVLAAASDVSRRTGGAFDITMAPLLELYSGAFAAGGPPPDDRIDEALALVDHRAVRIDGARVMLDDPRMEITLDGIAKGYIVDRTIDVLVAAGAERVLVNAGGDMATHGTDGRDGPWTVGIQDPHDEGLSGLARLEGDCIATSGDYMHAFTEDRRHHHIIDPRTGRSPEATSSVTVLAPTAMLADALSTALLVLGPGKGREALSGFQGAEGLWVTKDGIRIGPAPSGLLGLEVS
jgi:thiamine biosynthesis lipoprotein